jgi:hypothetical protein
MDDKLRIFTVGADDPDLAEEDSLCRDDADAANSDDYYDYCDPQGELSAEAKWQNEVEDDPSWSDQAAQDEFIDSAMDYLTHENPEVPF